MVWVGKGLKDHLFPVLLPWAEKTSARAGYSELHPAQP